MVTKMLKLTMRQIRSSLTRFLAIAAIVALGVGFFCGLRLTKTAMVHTLDDYAEAHRMYDFRLVSTVGFDETDADVLAADARIASCEGEKSADALASVADGAAKPCRFLSLPVQINFPGLKCGRLPQTAEECLADGLLYSEKDLGKTVVLTEENDEDTLDGFNRREFTIVGIAKSVLYINYERGSTSVGSGSLSAFVYVLPEAFDFDYDTELYLRLSNWLVIRRRETLQLKSHAMQVLQLIWRGLFVDMAQQVIAASELKDERLSARRQAVAETLSLSDGQLKEGVDILRQNFSTIAAFNVLMTLLSDTYQIDTFGYVIDADDELVMYEEARTLDELSGHRAGLFDLAEIAVTRDRLDDARAILEGGYTFPMADTRLLDSLLR